MSKGITFSDMLLRIAQEYKKSNYKYSQNVTNQINLLKGKHLLPSKLRRDDILITSWAWNEVVENKTTQFAPVQMLNEIYKSPQRTIHHLDNIICLINCNIFDSKVKEVSRISQDSTVKMVMNREILLDTEIFFTKEFISSVLNKKKKKSVLITGYMTNKQLVDDWLEYVSALEEVGWDRFRFSDPTVLKEDTYRAAKAWQKIVRRMGQTRKKFPLQHITEQYELDHNEQIIILYLLKDGIEGDSTNITELKRCISQSSYEFTKNQSYFEDDSRLVSNGIIELESLHGFKSTHEVRLTMDIFTKLMDENPVTPKHQIREMLQGNDIFDYKEPEISFDTLILEKEKKDILLHGINQYQNHVSSTLVDWGIYKSNHSDINQGLSILLYGPPGTGKTYCAQTIAHYLKKSLLTTDISKLLSCWVGESEQNVRRLFTTYEKIHKRVDNPPVLLLNEADQFLTKRGEANRSVDRMYNQMQNLFLEAFENFKGVLVCTTNLRDNLDPAFSRRFHLKLEFPLPKFEERKKLWKLHLPATIPGVSDIDIEALARRHELSGGQISVVIKNAATEAAGRQNSDRLLKQSDLEKYCILESESTFDGKVKKYGFCTQ
ncbi:ATP-binding protein [Candidatus Dojkabacteria bacterium]|nr:ATP-binding protein [Candidatus Dojkabacteria bacterium]